MSTPRDPRSLLEELIVAEVLARRGEGPLARKRWPAPPPRVVRDRDRDVVRASEREPNEPAR